MPIWIRVYWSLFKYYKCNAAFTSCLSSFPCCYGEIFWQSNFMEKGFMLAHGSSSSSPWQGSQGNSSVKQMLKVHGESWTRTKSNECIHLALFSILYSPRSLPTKWFYPYLKTHLPTSVDVIKVIPQMHAQMPFFQVIVDTVKLTIDMNSHTNHENEY